MISKDSDDFDWDLMKHPAWVRDDGSLKMIRILTNYKKSHKNKH